MEVIRGLGRIKKISRPIAALGVFDGLHKAHRRILSSIVRESRKGAGTSLAITFWPHPKGKKIIYSLEHRLRIIAELGVQACLVIDFTPRFSRMKAGDFISGVLVRKIGVKSLCVGEDFRFGAGAEGDVALLRKASRIYGFSLRVFPSIKAGGVKVSSTFIRGLISSGKLSLAARLLARPVSVYGKVIKGIGFAAKIGFPTANLDTAQEVLPPNGIYAVTAVLGGEKYPAVCFIGSMRPAPLAGSSGNRIEVHILRFNKQIYGINMEVLFLKKLRGEKRFSSPGLLVKQIKADILAAKKVFPLHHS